MIRNRIVDVSLVALIAFAFIWLSGNIMLTWASTDNLTELVAVAGPLSIPPPLFLLGVMIVLGCNAAVLLRASRSAGKALAIAVSAAAVPTSWWLYGKIADVFTAVFRRRQNAGITT